MRSKIVIALAVVAICVAPVSAQEEPVDPMEEYLFAPELLMLHQRAIGLDDEQRAAIKKEIREAETRFGPLEWDLRNEMEALGSLLGAERIDEERALALLERILELEKEMKKTHLSLVVRIKNHLSAEQQERLYDLRQR